METYRTPYPTDVHDDEWAFVAPYLTLITLDAPQRTHDLREVFDGLRPMVRAGAGWRLLPHDFPPWAAGYPQTQRWIKAGVFETIVHDLRVLLRLAAGREAEPTAAIFDSRTLQPSVESGERAGYDGAKRKRGSKVHSAVDTLGGRPLGSMLALHVSPANVGDRDAVAALAASVQKATGSHVTLAYVDAGYTGEEVARNAEEYGMRLEVVTLPQAKRGFVLLPRRWVVERDFAWTTRFRRLVRDYERLPETLAGLHLVAFVVLMLQRAFTALPSL